MPRSNIDFRDMEDYLKNISHHYGIDTLVLITRDAAEIPGTSAYVRGYSLFTRSFLSAFKNKPILFFIAGIHIIDLRSMKDMAFKRIYAEKETDDNHIKREFGELTTQEQEYCEDALKDIIREKIPLALTELHLTLDYTNGINRNEAFTMAQESLSKKLFNCGVTPPFDGGDKWKITVLWCRTGPLSERLKDEDIPTIVIDKKSGDIKWEYKQ